LPLDVQLTAPGWGPTTLTEVYRPVLPSSILHLSTNNIHPIPTAFPKTTAIPTNTTTMQFQSLTPVLFALLALNTASTYAGCETNINTGHSCSDNPGDSGCAGGSEIVRT